MVRRLAAIMFTDIAGYTALSQADEPAALRLIQEQKRLVRPLLEIHRGRLVKSIGDGLLVEFANSLDAVECAVDLQRHVQERNARESSPELRMRIGIHLGDVEGTGSDILGDAVNIASRVEPLAEPGGICLTEAVYGQVRNKVSAPMEPLGTKTLKGVKQPVGIYQLQWLPVAKPMVPSGSTVPRLAILPLSNISPDPKDEYFADGLTEELITVLSQVKGLRVISRTSVNQYKGTTKSVAQIASELGADSVLEGSVRKSGDQLRIAVQLIDTRTDEHRWAETYDRRMENVFAIQADVAERTASALKVELLRSEREAIQERPTSSLAAYDAYLRGAQVGRLLTKTWSLEMDREASQYFEEAIRNDPGFSGAYSALANHLLAVMGITRSAKETVPRARECAAKALELNPNSSDAHSAQGNLAFQADLNWSRAELELQQAIALNPSSSNAHFWYAYLLAALQRFKESDKHYRDVIELDPLWLLPRTNLVWNVALAGDIPAATGMLESLAEAHPDRTRLRHGVAFYYALSGRESEALRILEATKGEVNPRTRGSRATVLALVGQPEELRSLVQEYEDGRAAQYVADADAASLEALLGRNDRALALLEKDLREGDKVLWLAYQHWFLDSVRDDARFLALLRSANLPLTLSRPRWTPRHPPKDASTGTL